MGRTAPARFDSTSQDSGQLSDVESMLDHDDQLSDDNSADDHSADDAEYLESTNAPRLSTRTETENIRIRLCVTGLESTLQQANARIADLEADKKKCTKKIEALELAINEKDQRIEQLLAQIKAKDEQFAQFAKSFGIAAKHNYVQCHTGKVTDESQGLREAGAALALQLASVEDERQFKGKQWHGRQV